MASEREQAIEIGSVRLDTNIAIDIDTALVATKIFTRSANGRRNLPVGMIGQTACSLRAKERDLLPLREREIPAGEWLRR
jgi:hypothetical protein